MRMKEGLEVTRSLYRQRSSRWKSGHSIFPVMLCSHTRLWR